MKMLVPVDGSLASVNAVKKSIEIAQKYDFSVKLLYVVSPAVSRTYKRNEQLWRLMDGSMIEGRPLNVSEEELQSILTRSALEILDSTIQKLDFGNIAMEKEVLFGDPYMKILETAEIEKLDLIVMSNRGFSKIRDFFLGSVVQRVISEAKCPVLVVHSEAEA